MEKKWSIIDRRVHHYARCESEALFSLDHRSFSSSQWSIRLFLLVFDRLFRFTLALTTDAICHSVCLGRHWALCKYRQIKYARINIRIFCEICDVWTHKSSPAWIQAFESRGNPENLRETKTHALGSHALFKICFRSRSPDSIISHEKWCNFI